MYPRVSGRDGRNNADELLHIISNVRDSIHDIEDAAIRTAKFTEADGVGCKFVVPLVARRHVAAEPSI